MKKYLRPEFDITEFSSEDILVISGVNGGILDEEAEYDEIIHGKQ